MEWKERNWRQVRSSKQLCCKETSSVHAGGSRGDRVVVEKEERSARVRVEMLQSKGEKV